MTGYLLGLSLQISIVAGAALVGVSLLGRRSAALRHWILAVAVAASACLPMLQLVAPAWAVATVPGGVVDSATSAGATPVAFDAGARAGERVSSPWRAGGGRPTKSLATLAGWLPAAWLAGAGIGAIVLLGGLARLAWLARRARPLDHPTWTSLATLAARDLGVRRPVRLLHSSHPAFLAAWGWIHPQIILPRSAPDWAAADVRIVVRHELAHIARGDWVVQLFAEAVRAVNWFNPLVWLTARRLRSESERACDDLVLVQGVGGPEYAERLVALARSLNTRQRWCPAYPVSPMARHSTLEGRIVAMLDVTLNRSQVSRRARLAVAALGLAVAIPVAGLVLYAQSAGFAGTVFDQTNRAVPHVAVAVRNVQTQELREVRTDPQGRFEFASLPAGSYTFEARLPGFMTVKGTVAVTAQGLQRDLNLKVGSIAEVVSVAAGAAAGVQASAPVAQARPAPPRPPCTPGAAGGNIVPPRKLRDMKPLYPAHLVSERVGGPVVVEGTVGGDGAVRVLAVRSPHPDLARAVLDAVGAWLYDPTLLNCDPVDVRITITTYFALK
jgi:beta-lactamase regulating signal transducer with metallopeptidase domain